MLQFSKNNRLALLSDFLLGFASLKLIGNSKVPICLCFLDSKWCFANKIFTNYLILGKLEDIQFFLDRLGGLNVIQ